MTTQTRIALLIGALVAICLTLVLIVLGLRGSSSADESSVTAGPSPDADPGTGLPATTTDDMHILGEPGDGTVTVVEFLDFECEACLAFYPWWEDLREKYTGEVTFAIRYFPLPGHGNAMNAALAVEAAARQGQLEPMYAQMFATQEEWGERGAESQAHVFRGFATDLGLDLDQYDADVADPEVRSRVQSDVDDGLALGVTGTPTFFVNDRRVDLQYYEDLEDAIAAELAR